MVLSSQDFPNSHDYICLIGIHGGMQQRGHSDCVGGMAGNLTHETKYHVRAEKQACTRILSIETK